jgi:hypothetical protein
LSTKDGDATVAPGARAAAATADAPPTTDDADEALCRRLAMVAAAAMNAHAAFRAEGRAAMEPHLGPDRRARRAERRRQVEEMASTAPSVTEGWRRYAASFPPAGTPDGDLRAACCAAEPGEQFAALERTAARIPWKPRPLAYRQLIRRAQEEKTTYDRVKAAALATAVALVLGERDHADRLRVDRTWLKRADGTRAHIVPATLGHWDDLDGLWRWLRIRVPRVADRVAREEPIDGSAADVYAEDEDGQPRRVSLEEHVDERGADAVVNGEPDPLHQLLAAEARAVSDPYLLALLAKATPAQRRILDLLAEGHGNREAAALLGVSNSTVRAQLRKLRASAA